jgi:hypothetical protein
LHIYPWRFKLTIASSEQKIDDIAKSVDDVKLLLQGLSVASDTPRASDGSKEQRSPQRPEQPIDEIRSARTSNGEILWNHSTYIIDFIKTVVEEKALCDSGPETGAVVSSLQSLVKSLEADDDVQVSSLLGIETLKARPDRSMPPLDAVVAVLRWARGSYSTT